SPTCPAPTIPLPPAPPAPYELVDAGLTESRRELDRAIARIAGLMVHAPGLTPAERRTTRHRILAAARSLDAVAADLSERHTSTPGPEGWADRVVADGRQAS